MQARSADLEAEREASKASDRALAESQQAMFAWAGAADDGAGSPAAAGSPPAALAAVALVERLAIRAGMPRLASCRSGTEYAAARLKAAQRTGALEYWRIE